jgi:glutathione synthase/RimK-type ligase-like ATP-grasp enzyme
MHAYDIIILTDERYEHEDPGNWYIAQIMKEEGLLLDGLAVKGLRAKRVAWSNPDFDWSTTKAAVFRSTWDYFDRYREFSAWMDRVVSQTRLFNSPALLRWNLDKHYLRDLAERGVAIPSTRFVEIGESATLSELVAACGFDELILKPAISGGARHTYRFRASECSALESIFRKLISQESMLLQPFIRSVLTHGEISLIVIGGRCTHAVRKIAKAGDFRVQDDHGGTVQFHDAAIDEIKFAEMSVASCPESPMYARVDVVRDEHGALALMELELVEPELFFRFCPTSANALATALANALS